MIYPDDFDDLLASDKQEFENFDPKVQVAYCLHRLEAQVNNGGFHQFFGNSTGEYLLETIAALRAIEARKTAAILERAAAIGFPDGYPADPSEYEDALVDYDDVEDALDTLDREFFKYEEPLTKLVNEYLVKST